MASLGWFHDELTLSDSDKLEYVENSGKRACKLSLLLDHEDALDDGAPADYTVVDGGSAVFDYSSGYLDFTAGDGGDGLKSDDQFADLPYRFELDVQLKTATGGPYIGCNQANNIADSYHLFLAGNNGVGCMSPKKANRIWAYIFNVGSDEWTTVKITRDDITVGDFHLIASGGSYDGTIACPVAAQNSGAGAFYTMIGGTAGINFWARNLKLYLGYDTGGEYGYVVKDAGADKLWDGAQLATLAASLAEPDGIDYTNVTFDYSYDDGTPSWDTGNTLAQLKAHMEAIATNKRYFRLEGNLNSDAATQVVMMLPDMPEVPILGGGLLQFGKKAGKM